MRFYLFWIMPFIIFFLGYYGSARIMNTKSIKVPSVIGSSVGKALQLLNVQNLYMRIIEERFDEHKTPGTIMEQYPLADETVRPPCAIDVVIVKPHEYPPAPNLLGKSIQEAKACADHQHIDLTIIQVEHKQPHDQIVAQLPHPAKPMEKARMIVYCSKGNSSQLIMPNFINLSGHAASDCCQLEGIEPIFFYDTMHRIYDQLVVDQRPLPGTLINREKPPMIHLHMR